MIVFISILITAAAFAEESKELRQMTLSEISQTKGIRTEKLKSLIAPAIGAEQIGQPLEKIDPYITNELIQKALDDYLGMRTLQDLAEDTKYPIKKLKSKLGLEIARSAYQRPLREFGISAQRIEQALRDYREEETGFLWSIAATGMIIVFIALVITGIIVGLLEYFHRLYNRKLKRKTAILPQAASAVVDNSEGKISQRMKRRLAIISRRSASDEALDAYTVVAIAAAIRLHEAALEEENRILATWTKAPTSAWKTNRLMPNRIFFEKRWGR